MQWCAIFSHVTSLQHHNIHHIFLRHFLGNGSQVEDRFPDCMWKGYIITLLVSILLHTCQTCWQLTPAKSWSSGESPLWLARTMTFISRLVIYAHWEIQCLSIRPNQLQFFFNQNFSFGWTGTTSNVSFLSPQAPILKTSIFWIGFHKSTMLKSLLDIKIFTENWLNSQNE